MPWSRNVVAAILLAPMALAACGPQEQQTATDPVANQSAANNVQPPATLPPMVTRSPAYRCDDGRALYLDVMNDDSFVNVRDSRQDIPVRLDRNPETARYEGGGRSLSGTGDTVRYSAPDRAEQGCRAAAE